MRISVVIATARRRDCLRRTLGVLGSQTRRPDGVVISVTDLNDVCSLDDLPMPIRIVMSAKKGLTSQRNAAIDAVLAEPDASPDIVTFFDDDFLPAPDYLANLESVMSQRPDLIAICGHVVADGARNAGYTVDEGLRLLEEHTQFPVTMPVIRRETGTYGCNMSIRASEIGDQRFDERLVLYGWQEDIDFSLRVGRRSGVAWVSSLRGVHLGIKAGRVNGRQFGYSQIVNPCYLVRKGSMPARFAATLMARNLAANIFKSLRPEPWVDRRGRLQGNMIAIMHLLRGRLAPERVLEV